MIEDSALLRFSCYFMDFFRLPIFMAISDVPLDVHWDAMSHTWTSLSRTLHASIVEVDTMGLITNAAKIHPILMLHNSDDQVVSIDTIEVLARSQRNIIFESMGPGNHNAFLKNPRKYWEKVIIFELKTR